MIAAGHLKKSIYGDWITVEHKDKLVQKENIEEEEEKKKGAPDMVESLAVDVPKDFICGLSNALMQDPVTVSSGQTFERKSIQAWFDKGNRRCPNTHQSLVDCSLTPNLTLKAIISSWYKCTVDERSVGYGHNHTDLSRTSGELSSPSCGNDDAEKEDFGRISVVRDVSIGSLQRRAAQYFISAEAVQERSTSEIGRQSSSADVLRGGSGRIGRLGLQKSGATTLPLRGTRTLHNSFSSSDQVPALISTLVCHLQSDAEEKQMMATAQLRSMAKDHEENRVLIVRAGGLYPLIALLKCTRDEFIQRDATTVLLNLSLSAPIRPLVVDAGAIVTLVKVVKHGLSPEAMENAAVALSNLAVTEECKIEIGSAGAVPPLVELLLSGSDRGKKDAATAIYSLSSIDENKSRIVRAGASKLLVGFISCKTKGMIDKSLAIEANLATIEEGRVALVVEGGISSLMQVIKGSSLPHLCTELALSILLLLCTNSCKHRSLVLLQDPLQSLKALSGSENSRLRGKAADLLHVLVDRGRPKSITR